MYPTRQCIANRQGDVSIVSISRAITIGTPQEDVALSKFTSSDLVQLSTTPSVSIPFPPNRMTDSPSRI